MKQVQIRLVAILMLFCAWLPSLAQQTIATDMSVAVPPLVNFNGSLKDENGKPLRTLVGVTFYLYQEAEGGSPLWMETQNVQPDAGGHYSVMLGATSSTGLPAHIFSSGEAHWLAVQVQGQQEQPRVLLVSAPYALKAGDAETIGGLPPSAFVLASPSSSPSTPHSSVPGGYAPPPGTITGVLAGTDLTGGGTTGTVTLNLDTTKVPQLAAANTFTAKQTIKNTTVMTGTDGSGVLQVTNTVTSGKGPAIVGTASSSDANAVKGILTATTGSTSGVYGITSSATGKGVHGGGGIGVEGVATIYSATGAGGIFTGFSAVSGSNGDGSQGLVVTGGNGDMSGSDDGDGAPALSAYGGQAGYGGSAGVGIQAFGGSSKYGPAAGGQFTAGADAFGYSADGIDASIFPTSVGYAGNFTGDLNVSGAIYAGTKDFKIDHPLDPANKYFYHASIESSEMVNIYSGNTTTDAQGDARVQLPDWFESVNGDFRYQLTVIGQFAQAIVSQKIANHTFSIRTSVPNVEVSWQITGVRQDAFAKAHPLVVEQDKPSRERGYYIHPELYGAPVQKQVEWVRNPDWMKKSVAAPRQHTAAASQPSRED